VLSRSALILLIMLVLAGCHGSKPPLVGTSAPEFTASDSERSISLKQFRGKVVVLNFFASWCAPCREEMPSLVEMAGRMKDRGVTVLAVSEDVSHSDYRKFLTDFQVRDMVTVRDGNQSSAPLYGTHVYPETFIIDQNGIVQRKFVGPIQWTKPEIIEYLTRLQGSNSGKAAAD
jgi:cytochrome c biogenesis protein CcmG/thiol:disulfide interchange protein DsbE